MIFKRLKLTRHPIQNLRKLRFSLVLFLLVLSFKSFAQTRCITVEHNKGILERNPEAVIAAKAFEESTDNAVAKFTHANPIVIPVVFHIIYNTPLQNVSDARILKQMEVLNDDFGCRNTDITQVPSVFANLIPTDPNGTGIQFCLAEIDPAGDSTNGIIRVQTSRSLWINAGDSMKFSAYGGDDAWPRDQYLNIWVCNLANNVLGFATFPNTSSTYDLIDGVVLNHTTVGGPGAPGTGTGSLAAYNLGRTAVHEIGHYLSLYHIWGDSSCGDDKVNDTPKQQSPNFGCPNFPKVSNCTGNPPNGDLFMNYMDYVNDDCMHMFTQGQADRMNTAMNVQPRSLLQNSIKCSLSNGGTKGNGSIVIFPNPATDSFILYSNEGALGDFELNIYNTLGQLVQVLSFNGTGIYKLIDVTHLAAGIYSLEIVQPQATTVMKMIRGSYK